MLTVAPDSCSCRKCSVQIAKGEHISWAGGPYHLACTPVPDDWNAAQAANFFKPVPSSNGKAKAWSWSDFAAAGLMTIIPVIVLLIALAPGHPYGYFIFLRWVVCAGALLFVAVFHGHHLHRWMYGFGFIAILYNPIIRIHLTRDIWLLLNVLTVLAFLSAFGVLWLNSRRAAKSRT
jgi:hypothetical protein